MHAADEVKDSHTPEATHLALHRCLEYQEQIHIVRPEIVCVPTAWRFDRLAIVELCASLGAGDIL